MLWALSRSIVGALLFWMALFFARNASGVEQWNQFRGPTGQGTSTATGLPVHWSEVKNVRWKTDVPGNGHSSPVVAGEDVWLTTAARGGHSLRALSFDRTTGTQQQDVEVFHIETPDIISEPLGGHACSTPFVDGERVYVSFGPNGQACLGLRTGKVLWRNTELAYRHDQKGIGTSPIVWNGFFIVSCDGMDRSRVVALHKGSGQMAWFIERSKRLPYPAIAYSSPTISSVHGQERLFSIGAFRLSCYEPRTGQELWFCDLPGNSIIPRPVHGLGMVYVCTGGTKPELWALRTEEDMTEKHRVAWKTQRQVPFVSSPVLVETNLFWVSDGGIVCCVDASTGRERRSQRIGGRHFASPVAAEGRIYFFDDSGRTVVCRADSEGTIVATNSLESGFMASPAIAGRAFYLRTRTHLYKIETPGD
ncbi:MAG: PQQ-binding-like beta-propeller repeat protein [Verrucomicrobia bacterium]|nr:PQQ-binding-like beta-propeller repeat protein [Verrucomicrobiota bacterium]